MNNPFLARFSGVAAFVEPSMHDQFTASLDALGKHPIAESVLATTYAQNDDFWTELPDYMSWLRPYVVKNGVLRIPVAGVLLKDFPYQFANLATGYEYIRAAFDRGLRDPDVESIVFVHNTPGGMVAGNFDLVDHIYENRGAKPISAFADEHSYSAGYSLISAVDPGGIVVARTGGVGSIGVVTYHVDISEMMSNVGVKVTYIYAGKHKIDGNPHEPLPDDVKERFQAMIDDLYSVFVSTVARNRNLDESIVRGTEALTFQAAEAVSRGLADKIGSLDDAVAANAASLSSKRRTTMSGQTDTSAVDQAAIDAATAAGVESGKAQGAKAEKERIMGILACEPAQKRQAAALGAALDTDMTVEQATKFLARLPEEAPAKAASPAGDAPKGAEGAAKDFQAAMNASDNPNLGAPDTGNEKQASRSERVLALAGRTRKSAA